MARAPTFHVVPGSAVKNALSENRQVVYEAVETAYRLHSAGDSVNPDSYFLRYPTDPLSRIIALPAHLGGKINKSGIKWIASFPANRADNLARASAVQILNDATTGYPLACIEASLISATRTAASAALAAEHLDPMPFTGSLCVVGTGVIARSTVDWLLFRGWKFERIGLFDLDPKEAERFRTWLREQGLDAEIHPSLDVALRAASLIVLTTTATRPYLADETLLAHRPTILHLSLRDIAVNVVLSSQNVVDDVDHCLKADTSVHLAEQATGNRQFIDGVLVDLLDKKIPPDAGRTRIFSPFGLGVLDIAVSHVVLQNAIAAGTAVAVPDFFSNSARW